MSWTTSVIEPEFPYIYSMFTRDITVNKRKRKKAKEKRKGTKREFNRNQTNASV